MSKKSKLARVGAAGCALAVCLSGTGGVLNGNANADSKYVHYYCGSVDGKTDGGEFWKTKFTSNDTKYRGYYDEYDSHYSKVIDGINDKDVHHCMKAIMAQGFSFDGWDYTILSSKQQQTGFAAPGAKVVSGYDVKAVARYTDLKHDVYYGEEKLTEGEDFTIKDDEERVQGAIKFNRVINFNKSGMTQLDTVKDIDIKYTFTPSVYYAPESYKIDDGDAQEFTGNVIIAEDVKNDITLDIDFARVKFNLEVEEAEETGNIDVEFADNENEGTTATTAVVLSGDDQIVKIAPIAGHKITKVEIKEGEGEAVEAEITDPELFEKTFEEVLSNYTVIVTTAKKQYTVNAEFEDETGSVLAPVAPVELGNEAVFSVELALGYKFDGATSEAGEVDAEYSEEGGVAYVTVKNIDDELEDAFEEVNLVFHTTPKIYKVVEGFDNQEVDMSVAPASGEEREVIIKIDGELELLKGVEFDGRLLGEDEYKATSGSTVLHFGYDFIAAAGNGEHSIMALYDNGTFVETTLKVSGIPVSPDTGAFSAEKGSVATPAIFGVATISLFGLIVAAIKKFGKKQA